LGDLLLASPSLDRSADALRERLIIALELAGGHLETHDRDVIYVVPMHFRRAIARRDAQAGARRFRARAWRATTRVARVAFGAFLVVSVTIVALAVMAMIVIALSRGHERGGSAPVLPTYVGNGRPGIDGDFWFYLYMRDLMHLSLYEDMIRAERMRAAQEYGVREVVAEGVPVKGAHPGSGARGTNGNGDGANANAPRRPPNAPRRPPNGGDDDNDDDDDWLDMKRELTFMESIYAFVFGRGDPNESLDVRRWRAIGALLRVNRGAVFAEQVAPFLDSVLLPKEDYAEVQHGMFATIVDVVSHVKRVFAKKSDAERDASRMHEGYMLEVLTRFSGYAEASDDGKLIYVFPALQVSTIAAASEPSTSTGRRAPPTPSCIPAPSPPPIYERIKPLWERGEKMPLVIALGILNIFLIWVFRAAGGMDFKPPRQPLKSRQAQTMGRRAGRFHETEPVGLDPTATANVAQVEYAEPPLVILFLELLPMLCKAMMPLLLMYAFIFFALPCSRAAYRFVENMRIRRRNEMRKNAVLEVIQRALGETDKQRAAYGKQALELVV